LKFPPFAVAVSMFVATGKPTVVDGAKVTVTKR
jgi:hypothetical protein